MEDVTQPELQVVLLVEQHLGAEAPGPDALVVQHEGLPNMKLPKFTHAMLAEIVGTTRSRISFFMNKFRKLGLISYARGGDITVMPETLTNTVLHE